MAQNLGKKDIFRTPGNSSLPHQEVVPDFMYEPTTKKSLSLTAAIINAADNGNLAAKITITQEEGSIDTCRRSIPQKRTDTLMVSSKTWNHHICEILYNFYENNIFQKKNFVAITAPSFIK